MFNLFLCFDPAKPLRFYEPDSGAGTTGGGCNNGDPAGGGNNNPNNGAGPNNGAPSANNSDDISGKVKTAIAELLGKNGGDKDATLDYLVKRAHGLEKQRDEARQNELSKEDRALLDGFKALNLTPDQAKTILAEHGTWKTEVVKQGLWREKTVRKDEIFVTTTLMNLDEEYFLKAV